MLRNRISTAIAATFITLAPLSLQAGGMIDRCPPLGQDVVALLQRYASTDPANYCVRAMTLAQTNCRPQEVVAAANQIGQQYRLPPVVPGCQPPVLMSAIPLPLIATIATETVTSAGMSGWWLAGLAPLGGLGLIEGGGEEEKTTTTATNIDDEYNAQYGLSVVKAKKAYQRGYTGKGVVVALIDTGVDTSHPEFAGRIAAGGGYDFVNNRQGMPDADELNPHGTEVAGVLGANRNFHGMHGVAYDVTIDPLRVFDEDGNAIANFVGAINYAVSHGDDIINGSYGPDTAWHQYSESVGHQVIIGADLLEGAAYVNAVQQGAILIFPAGNDYLTAPEIASNPTGPGFLPFIRPSNKNITDAELGAYRDVNGNVINADFSGMEAATIVVVGTDANGNILDYSNRCGVAKNWCMAAPADSVFTTAPNGQYTTVDGTSFAAPHVAGAAAILKQAFPSLTNAQIVDLLLTTATDLGTPGVDVIYGHGLLNLDAATAPQGNSQVQTAGYIGGSSASLKNTSLVFGPAFGLQASAFLASKDLAFFDAYDRAYTTSLNGIVRASLSGFDTDDAVFNYGEPEEREEYKLDDNLKVGFVMDGNGSSTRLTPDAPRDQKDSSINLKSFALNSSVTESTSASVHYKDSVALTVGFSEADRGRVDQAINKQNLKNPYASLADNGYATIVETEGLGGKVRVAGFFGREGTDENAGRIFGGQAEANYGIGTQSTVSLSFGSVTEDGYVLGSKGEGAFAFGSGTTTMYSGIGASFQLNADTTLRGTAYVGYTNPSLSDNSLITDMSSMITTAFAAAIERKNLNQEGDVLTLGISQPLRVESGSMQINLPYARDASSNAVYSNNLTQDVGAEGREIDVEASYAFPLDTQSAISIGSLYRHNAGHQLGVTDLLGVVRYTKKF
jgi:subtilisin family serine protease